MTKGERIKKARERIGMSQVALADKIGVSKQTMYKYENDIITNIPSNIIEAIASITQTTPQYIMGWDTIGQKNGQPNGYYVYGDTAEIAQEIFENPETRALFDASRGSRPEDLQMAIDLLNRLKRTNPDG